MVLSKSILILEDDLRTLSAILSRLSVLEDEQPFSFTLTILTDYTQVEKYINSDPDPKFDIILLDRDCKLCRSFHVLDIERFGVDKVIAISSVPDFNIQLQKRGVTKVVEKDYANLKSFAEGVVEIIEEMIRKMPLIENE
jgi:hypothetical protein